MFDEHGGCILFVCILLVVILVVVSFMPLFPGSRSFWNRWDYDLKKVDENTKYESLKDVEDTARAMRANYRSAIVNYTQFKNSTNEEERGWANQFKMTANNIASTYNDYILKNSFKWKNNVPEDIADPLPFVTDTPTPVPASVVPTPTP